MAKKKRQKLNFSHLLVEAVLIVFTVTLALTLNEWRSNVKANATKEKVLKNIVNEIESNKEDLIEKMNYHKETSIRIRDYLNNDSLWSTLNPNSGIQAVSQLMPQGILNPNLQSGAWNSAVLSGVVNSFEYERLFVLSNLYQTQETGVNTTWKVITGFYSDYESFNREKSKQVAMRFQLAIGELYNQEKSLLKDYDLALNAIELKD